MDGKTVVTGGLALVVGLLLGVAIAPSGGDMERLEAAFGARMDEAAGTMDDTMSGLSDTLGTLDAKLSDMSERVAGLEDSIGAAASEGADATAERLAEIEARIAETAQSMQDALSDTAENQAAALSAALADFADDEQDTAAAPAEAPASTETAEAPTAEAADPDAPPPEGLTAGETAMLADGAIRVFVSRVDASGARLSVNGTMAHLNAGHSLALRSPDSYCRVMLEAVDRGHASLSAACGDDLPAPEGVKAGGVALLGDGAARVFVSRVAEDDSTVRIAVNGLDLQTVSAGGSVAAGDCAVRVDQIDRGHVSFGYGC